MCMSRCTAILRSYPDHHLSFSMEETKGASDNERLFAAARTDNEELLLEIFRKKGKIDINAQDGLGNTALHNAVLYKSTDVLEHILSHEDCDVDPLNRIDKATPLHIAVRIKEEDLRLYIVDSLLDAGADISIRDKNRQTVLDIIPAQDKELRALIRKHQTQASISKHDVVSDGEDGELGSGSDSEEG